MSNEELQESLNEAMRVNARLMSELQQVKRSANDISQDREQLASQVEQFLTYMEDAHSTLGFLSTHLRGRMGEAALLDMAEKADDWREFCDQIRQQAKVER